MKTDNLIKVLSKIEMRSEKLCNEITDFMTLEKSLLVTYEANNGRYKIHWYCVEGEATCVHV